MNDSAANTTYQVGETVTVSVIKHPYPDHSKPYGLLSFSIMSQRSAARFKRRQAPIEPALE